MSEEEYNLKFASLQDKCQDMKTLGANVIFDPDTRKIIVTVLNTNICAAAIIIIKKDCDQLISWLNRNKPL